MKLTTNLLGRLARIKTTGEIWPGTPLTESGGPPLAAIVRQHSGKVGEIVTVVSGERLEYSVLVDGEIISDLPGFALEIVKTK